MTEVQRMELLSYSSKDMIHHYVSRISRIDVDSILTGRDADDYHKVLTSAYMYWDSDTPRPPNTLIGSLNQSVPTERDIQHAIETHGMSRQCALVKAKQDCYQTQVENWRDYKDGSGLFASDCNVS